MKIVFLSFVVWIFLPPAGVYADFYDTDINREQSQIRRIDELKNEEEKGYQYDSLQRDKELIFKQLEVITGDEETRYIIVPGDTLSVAYKDQGVPSGAIYKVSSKGEIFLPMVGATKVGGLNRQEARSLISQKFEIYIRSPAVELTVNAAGRIMVLGEVNLPGLYNMQPNLTVMEAILKAGSYNKESASLKGVILIRGADNKSEIRRLNLYKMITKADRTDDVFVKPGDLVYVPKTLIADLTKFKDEVYKWVSLYYSYGRLPASPPVEKGQPVLYER